MENKIEYYFTKEEQNILNSNLKNKYSICFEKIFKRFDFYEPVYIRVLTLTIFLILLLLFNIFAYSPIYIGLLFLSLIKLIMSIACIIAGKTGSCICKMLDETIGNKR